jgi:glycosyltransferase involved in cell wall biosynthesis
VLYITYDGLSDPLGQSQILPYLLGLSKERYQFTILSFEKKDRFASGEKTIRELMAPSNIHWIPLSFTTSPPVLSKLYDVWQMTRMAIKLHRKNKFDIIHCRSYIAAQVGLKLKKKFGVAFLFDMRGFWADEKKEAGRWPDFIYRHYKKLERELLLQGDAIISLTHAAKKEMISWNIGKNIAEKISVIPCCADLDLFNFSSNRTISPLAKEAEGHYPIINYLGSLGPAYGTKEMLQFFNLVKQKFPSARFFFYTKDDSGIILNQLEEYKYISPKDFLFRFVSRKELPQYLAFVDYSLFFYQPAYSRLACSPTKFAELAGMGIPVICNSVGDLNEEFLGNTANKVINYLSEENMKKLIDSMGQNMETDKNQLREFALNRFSLKSGIAAYAEVYKKLGL